MHGATIKKELFYVFIMNPSYFLKMNYSTSSAPVGYAVRLMFRHYVNYFDL
jgi:hypothetical protein